MTKHFKIKKGLYLINSILFMIIVLSYFGGLMTFGLGFGDLVPLVSLSLYVLVNTTLTIVTKDKLYLTMLFIISVGVFCLTIWGLTFGRGTGY
jgi:hypothetical protein